MSLDRGTCRLLRVSALVLAALVGLAVGLFVDRNLGRLLIALAALAVLLVPRLPVSLDLGRFSSRGSLLLLLATLSAAQATGPQLWHFISTPWVRVWNVYHYYLGSKYFAELGYHDLYVATLAADRDGYWNGIRSVRDQHTYAFVPRAVAVTGYRPLEHFSEARWAAFERDVAALRTHRPPERWAGVFRDRGYNPSPAWTAIGGLLSHVNAGNLVALKLLCSLDLLLLAAAFTLIARTFGIRTMALALLLFTLSPVNDNRIVGGFLQYDWFAALSIGLCQLRRRHPVSAGLAFAYATATRIFPAVLLVSAAVPIVWRFIRRGHLAPRYVRLGVAIAGFGVLFGLLGAAAAGGLDAWDVFAKNISHHNAEHRFGERRLGLGHIFTHDIRSLDFAIDRPRRQALFERQHDLFVLAGALALAGWLMAVGRRPAGEALLLGLVPLFVLTVSSRYYWVCLALLPMLSGFGSHRRRTLRGLAAGQIAVFAGAALYAHRHSAAFARYSVFGMLLALFLAGWLGMYLLKKLRTQRLVHPLHDWYHSRTLVLLFFVFLLLLLAWLRLPHPDLPIRDVDESVSALIAANWLEGGVPYRDAIDQRGPVTYAIYAGVFALSGVYDMRAVHLALLLLILASAYGVFRLGRIALPNPDGTAVGMLAAFLLVVSSFTYRRSQMLAFHTEWPMMLLDVLAMLLVLRGLRRRSSVDLVLAGACFAGGFLSKQPGIFDAGAAAMFVLLRQHQRGNLFCRETARFASLLATGFFSVLGFAGLYFATAGAFSDFLFYYWTYNVEHYTAVVPWADRLGALNPFAHSRHYLTANPLLLVGAVTASAVAALRGLRYGRCGPRLLFALWMMFGFFGASYSGRNFGHYFIQIIPPACLLTALAVRDLWRATSPAARRFRGAADLALAARAALIIAMTIGLVMPIVRFSDEIAWRTLWSERPLPDARARLLAAIRARSSPSASIFVWGYDPELYMLAPRRPASRYSNANYLTGMLPWENHQPGVDTSAHIVEGAWSILLNELQTSKPQLVIDTAVGNRRWYAKYPIRKFPRLATFLEKGYRYLGTVDDARGHPIAGLWQRAGTAQR